MNAKHKDIEIPIEIIEYLFDNFGKIKEIDGEVIRTSQYGGSIFVVFKSKRCYKINISLYNSEVTLD